MKNEFSISPQRKRVQVILMGPDRVWSDPFSLHSTVRGLGEGDGGKVGMGGYKRVKNNKTKLQ